MALATCRCCKQERKIYSRDCCLSCYHSYRYDVQTGKTTWEKLELGGWVGFANRARRRGGVEITKPTYDSVKVLAPEVEFIQCTQCGFHTENVLDSLDHRKTTKHTLRPHFKKEFIEIVKDEQRTKEEKKRRTEERKEREIRREVAKLREDLPVEELNVELQNEIDLERDHDIPDNDEQEQENKDERESA